jgi:hypothetical protein
MLNTIDCVAKLQRQIATQDREIEKLRGQLEKILKLPSRCICGHYHCSICGNLMTLDVNFEKQVTSLKAENLGLKAAVKIANKDYDEILQQLEAERTKVVRLSNCGGECRLNKKAEEAQNEKKD